MTNAVVCGDFNISRESPLFGEFTAATEPDAAGRVGGIRAVPLAKRGAEQDIAIWHQQSVNPGDPVHRVTHVLLQEGHLWGRKKVSIPVSAVTGVENGIRLSLTKKQVEDLPPAD